MDMFRWRIALRKMVKSIKNNPWEFFIVLLLTIIIGMVGYYVDRLTVIQDEMGMEVKSIGQTQRNIAWILAEDPDTKPTQKGYLYEVSFSRRSMEESKPSASSQDQSINTQSNLMLCQK